MGPATDKHQAPFHRLKLYVRTIIESEEIWFSCLVHIKRSLAEPEVEIINSGTEGYLQYTLSGSRFNRDAVPLRSLL